MKLFESSFYRQLSETNAAGAGGVFGDAGSMGFGGAMTPATDFYAPGDMRTPMGGKKQAKKSKKQRKAAKPKKDGSISPLIPMQRRPLHRDM